MYFPVVYSEGLLPTTVELMYVSAALEPQMWTNYVTEYAQVGLKTRVQYKTVCILSYFTVLV
jgi:hypothetical protein